MAERSAVSPEDWPSDRLLTHALWAVGSPFLVSVLPWMHLGLRYAPWDVVLVEEARLEGLVLGYSGQAERDRELWPRPMPETVAEIALTVASDVTPEMIEDVGLHLTRHLRHRLAPARTAGLPVLIQVGILPVPINPAVRGVIVETLDLDQVGRLFTTATKTALGR